ncbi:hypothetical protein FHS04_002711 [Mesoflavibacter sabulilitoris]|nr:hypothetical protein [Mesoflavibacter zeaxanthinifaciens]MBB3125170.1 hypothetical protein [Mesoflavibacter zeaxanthinifaciens subsp. sabulilitoris]
MNLKKITYLILISLVITSCINNVTEVSNWLMVDSSNVETIEGSYHKLDKDPVRIYLPSVFKRKSGVEFEKILDSISSDKNSLKLEYARLKQLREIEGNFYIYFDKSTFSTYTINTLPYMPLQRQDAKFLLGIISQSNRENENNLDLKYTKVTAKYDNSVGPQIFKSIFKVEDTKSIDNPTFYNSTYIVSYNNKTVFIQLSTPFEANFDPFLQKMIL